MKNKSYFDTALDSIKTLKENLILFIPDLILFLATALIAYLFLHFNNLTVIFSDMEAFASRMRDIVSGGSSLIKVIISFAFLVLINALIGLGTVCMRYNLIRMAVKKEKVSFKKSYHEIKKQFFSLLGIKILLTVIYSIPVIILGGLALLVFKDKIILTSLVISLVIILLIVIKLMFLFVYATLFLKTNKGVISSMKESVKYFISNKKKVVVVGIILLIVNILISYILKIIPSAWGNQQGFIFTLSFLAIIYLLISNLVSITINLWSDLFIFKNY